MDPSLPLPYMRDLAIYQAGTSAQQVGRGALKLASNENPLGASPKAIRAIELACGMVHRYPDGEGHQLREALAQKWDIPKEGVALGAGSEGILLAAMRAFVAPGDKALTSASTFIGMPILAKGAGAQLIEVPLNAHYGFDVGALGERLALGDCKIFYLANPNNPTGTYVNTKEFEFLLGQAPESTLFIVDEAYFEYARHLPDYPDSSLYRAPNLLTLRTFSKAYGLAGLRVGYALGPGDLISSLRKGRATFEPNALAQEAALWALDDEEFLAEVLKSNERNLAHTQSFLAHDMGLSLVPPKGTNFVMFRPPDGRTAKGLYEDLLAQGVIIRPLGQNGLHNHLRLSIGTDEQMAVFREKFKSVL